MRGQGLAAQQAGAGLAHRGRGLYAVAALPRHPEKARRTRIEAADQAFVGHKRAQARPGVRGAADGQCGGGLQAVDGQGNVQLFGLHVLRVGGVGVGG